MRPHKLVDGDAPKVEMLKQEVVEEPESDEVEGSRMKVYMKYAIRYLKCSCNCAHHAQMLCKSCSDAPPLMLKQACSPRSEALQFML